MAGDGRERPDFTGDGGGASASRERGRVRERYRDGAVWFDQTGSGQVDPVGSDLWAQGHFGLFTNALK